MNFLITSFLISLALTLAIIRYQHLHENLSSDHDLSGPQKFHSIVVPRIGGIGIFFSIIITSMCALFFFSLDRGSLILQISACAIPAFGVGLIEDLTKKAGVKKRLMIIAISAGLTGYFMDTWVNDIHIPTANQLLAIKVISITFTIIAITGLTNAYNIIDGFNGLAAMVAIISLLAIGYIAYKVNDSILSSACLILIGGIAGFFIFNFPRGLIFLGDGGAYLIGFFISVLSILLVKRNPTVSPWFALLVNIYPIFETLFTIWRRKIYQGKNPGLADGAHFHSLIYRRLIRWADVHKDRTLNFYSRNAKTSPYLWILSSMATLPAIIWWDNTWVLQSFILLFCATYVLCYKAVVKFKTPWILKLFK